MSSVSDHIQIMKSQRKNMIVYLINENGYILMILTHLMTKARQLLKQLPFLIILYF